MLWVTNTTVRRARGPQRGELAVEALPREFVERAERLVHQQEIRRGDERAGDGGAHLHAARELARKMARELREPDLASAARVPSSAAARSTPARSSGSRTFASTRAHGISVGAWNTKPRRRPGPPVAAKSPPHQRSVPPLGATSPAMRLRSVVLPQPEGPSRVRNSPRAMARSTGASARVPFGIVLVGPGDRDDRRACRNDGAQGRTFTFRDDGQRVGRRIVDARLREPGAAKELERLLPPLVGHRQETLASRCRRR